MTSAVRIPLLVAVFLVGCDAPHVHEPIQLDSGPFQAVIAADLQPSEPQFSTPDGNVRFVGASRDEDGVVSEFTTGEILVQPDDAAHLASFLERYEGEVIGDDEVPEPPPELEITLTPEERAPRLFLVRLNLAKVSLASLQEDAAALGLDGVLEFSSEDALKTFAAIADASAAGYPVAAGFMSKPTQFPRTLLRTTERDGTDAFATAHFGSGEGTPNTNVTLAWQFIAAHGIERRVNVALIDGGFWVDPDTGRPLRDGNGGTDLPERPAQWDFSRSIGRVGVPNPASCTGNKPCPWHGNMVAGASTGLIDNGAGAAGTGGLVADPMLFHVDVRDRLQKLRAIRSAAQWGADVISMSYGGYCNKQCRSEQHAARKSISDPIAMAHQMGVVMIASAGNEDELVVKEGSQYHPCAIAEMICVGANNLDGTKVKYSSFGPRVDIWAPTHFPVMADGETKGELGQAGGTSASTPFVAGIVAMMKALDPSLGPEAVRKILHETAHTGPAPVERRIDAYAAVIRAAEGKTPVRDRSEPGTIDASPLPFNASDLTLHYPSDRDVFRFEVPIRSQLRVSLEWPQGLGQIPIHGIQDACESSRLITDMAPQNGRPRILRYQVPAGPASFTIGGPGAPLLAYNIEIEQLDGTHLYADDHEPNDSPDSATQLFHSIPLLIGGDSYFQRSSDFAIDANIDRSNDVDYYFIRGSSSQPSGGGYFRSYPTLTLSGNESPISMKV